MVANGTNENEFRFQCFNPWADSLFIFKLDDLGLSEASPDIKRRIFTARNYCSCIRCAYYMERIQDFTVPNDCRIFGICTIYIFWYQCSVHHLHVQPLSLDHWTAVTFRYKLEACKIFTICHKKLKLRCKTCVRADTGIISVFTNKGTFM